MLRSWPFACAIALLLGIVVCACDHHTAMRISPCRTDGETRACTNPCGEGLQTCMRGTWSGCVVPPLRLACTNVCGEGTRLCQDGRLADACDLPPVRLACTNACGEGTRLCQDGRLADACEVSPVHLPCSTTCGEGTRLCQDGKLAAVCDVPPVVLDCSTICGPGNRTCADDKWQPCTAKEPKQPKLTALVRDFHGTATDMNRGDVGEAPDPGIAASSLGADDKPVYAHTGATLTVSSPQSFNQWFRDVPGVNTATTIDIPLTPSGAGEDVYTYRNTDFFPIDGQLFGNEDQSHNYAFTAEIATRFRYKGGEVFTFSGDDDVFVFINRILAIDLGGIHSAMSQTVDLDAQASELGLTKGGIFSMHIFFAERHPTGSDFIVETSISEFAVCD